MKLNISFINLKIRYKMKKHIICIALVMAGLAVGGCQQKKAEPSDAVIAADSLASVAGMKEHSLTVGDVTFTHVMGGADTCATVGADGVLEFKCGAGRDMFSDPNGQLTNNTLPMLLSEVDNTKPFTLTAKVMPGFTADGVYNAADLLVFANDSLWQKLCFEQDERGEHRIVSVRTQGTSDDNNHERLDASSVYLKLSSDTRTIASYYSLDNKEWRMVRLYENYYPDRIWVGIASQCPQKGVCVSAFDEISLRQTSVSDFRMGD